MAFQEESESEGPAIHATRKSTYKGKPKSKVGRPKKRRFICEYCGKSFLHSGHFSHHIRTRHGQGQSQFMCLTCNEMFMTKEELITHQEEAEHTGEGMAEVQTMEGPGGEIDETTQVNFLSRLSRLFG